MRDSWHFVYAGGMPPITVDDEDLARAIAATHTPAVAVHLQHEGDREVFRAGVQLDEWLPPVWYLHAVIGCDIYGASGNMAGTETAEIDRYVTCATEPDAAEWAWDRLRHGGSWQTHPTQGGWYVLEATATKAPGARHLVTGRTAGE